MKICEGRDYDEELSTSIMFNGKYGNKWVKITWKVKYISKTCIMGEKITEAMEKMTDTGVYGVNIAYIPDLLVYSYTDVHWYYYIDLSI